MKVTKKLKKIGNSNFLLIPKDLMDYLNLQEGSEITIEDVQDSIVIKKKTLINK